MVCVGFAKANIAQTIFFLQAETKWFSCQGDGCPPNEKNKNDVFKQFHVLELIDIP